MSTSSSESLPNGVSSASPDDADPDARLLSEDDFMKLYVNWDTTVPGEKERRCEHYNTDRTRTLDAFIADLDEADINEWTRAELNAFFETVCNGDPSGPV